jgi:hypothetical protein
MAEVKLSNAKRAEVEKYIYDVLDAADVTHTNSDYYKALFATMDNTQFYNFFTKRMPIRFHQAAFKVEPKMYELINAFKILGAPLFEEVNLPYLYTDSNGKPIRSKECLVIYLHIKRMKQMLSKKNSTAISISNRDMRTGLLVSHDKGGKESDLEFTTLAVTGLDHTMDEFARVRGDAMRSKEELYNIISTKGAVTEGEVQPEPDESLAANYLYCYLLGANIVSNVAGAEDSGYITPFTMRNKKRDKLER